MNIIDLKWEKKKMFSASLLIHIRQCEIIRFVDKIIYTQIQHRQNNIKIIQINVLHEF